MLVDDLKKRMFQAMKQGNTVEKEILRTALGEITKSGDEATDERVTQVLKKLVKSNEETLAATQDESTRTTLEQEVAVLQGFLPKSLGPDELVAALAPVAEQMRAAKADGPAMGLAMKFLKQEGLDASGKDVKLAVARLRQA